jgi:pyruvate formate lyase activating enzyme
VSRLYAVRDAHSCVKKVELLKFRKLCLPKYENLGIEFPLAHVDETRDEDIERIK